MVLLHPFLYPLFEKLKYLKDKAFKDTQSQHRAVLITQYLTNCNAKIFENELILSKILCGVPLHNTVHTQWKVTKQEKEQCKKLLESVIEHWKILKNTSVQTLQENFIQRDAMLVKNKKEQYEITVEQKTIDLLLDQLPWGFKIIKTPWMKHFLTCHWN